MNTRQSRGELIVEKNDQIRRINETHYEINSQSRDKTHDVIGTEFGWSCSCEDNYFRKICCKHIHAVEISLKLRQKVKQKVVINPVESNCCIFCKSANIKKKGIRKNKTYSIQKYQCKECEKYFSINLGFEGMHASPQVITSAMQLYFTGESLRGVQKFLRLQGINFNHTTIYRWVNKYIKLIDNYLSTITPQVGNKWHADEVWLKINSDKKYLFAMMDSDTRFWIAQEVADSKFSHDAQNLLVMSKKVAKKIPSVFVTDGLPAYNKSFKQEFEAKNFLHKSSKHIRDIHFKHQLSNNNIQERLNGEFRDREKVFRGIKKADGSIITGIKMHHNYIRPHMSLHGDTPADRSGIEIKGDNKWLTIIQNAQVTTRNTKK